MSREPADDPATVDADGLPRVAATGGHARLEAGAAGPARVAASDGQAATAARTLPTPPAEINPDTNTVPSGATGVPPEPPRIPRPDTGAMLPQKGATPAKSTFYFNTGGQITSQTNVLPPGVQPATYERPATYSSPSGMPNAYPATSSGTNAVTPTIYDAPPRYPTTQQQFYR